VYVLLPGKTLQTISLIGFLREQRNINGPHLVITPKSTISGWMREFAKWCPSVKVVKYVNSKNSLFAVPQLFVCLDC
jgi:SWI/SNF-related matrix-associated actin-dependent regulator of chromatin subfamily A member 5